MWSRDWPGWHIIAAIAGVIIGAATLITPANLGITQITVNWIILLTTIVGGVSAVLGNSGLPGAKEVVAMQVGKAVISPTLETKSAAVAAIQTLEVKK